MIYHFGIPVTIARMAWPELPPSAKKNLSPAATARARDYLVVTVSKDGDECDADAAELAADGGWDEILAAGRVIGAPFAEPAP